MKAWFLKRFNIQKPNGRRLAAIQRKRGRKSRHQLHSSQSNFVKPIAVGKLNPALPAAKQRSQPDFLPLTRAGGLPIILYSSMMFSFQINENKLTKLDNYKKTLREHFNLFRTPKFKKWVRAFVKVKIKKRRLGIRSQTSPKGPFPFH